MNAPQPDVQAAHGGGHGGANAGGDLSITTERAPVAANGTTAGAPTDFVVTFADRDPDDPGVAMKTGGTIVVELADGFENTGDCVIPATCNAIILRGWPQSPFLGTWTGGRG